MNLKARAKKIARHPATHVIATVVTAVAVAKTADHIFDISGKIEEAMEDEN